MTNSTDQGESSFLVESSATEKKKARSWIKDGRNWQKIVAGVMADHPFVSKDEVDQCTREIISELQADILMDQTGMADILIKGCANLTHQPWTGSASHSSPLDLSPDVLVEVSERHNHFV